MTELSILIPARNEQFLKRTIEDILAHTKEDTEIIAVLDGVWAEPAIPDHPRVTLIYHPQSIGQRAATNEAARVSTAKYIMKCDAHCSFDDAFDMKLIDAYESGELGSDVTTVPRMFNLHAFDWVCECGERTYQGPHPGVCSKCGGQQSEMDILWRAKPSPTTDAMRFDHELHFQYFGEFKKRPEGRGDITETMSLLGACWMMRRERFWELGGMDEAHGSWGQMGTEIACKSWLSGGQLVCNKRTWFAHLFRTQPGFGFPYPNPGIERARERSRYLWFGNNWSGQVRPLSWLIEKFAPLPGWHDPIGAEALARVNAGSKTFNPKHRSTNNVVSIPSVSRSIDKLTPTKGFVFYTDNRLDEYIARTVRHQLTACCNGYDLVSVSLKPLDFGRNITLQAERGPLTMFRQILAGLEASTADVVFLVEHDVLYHPSHFNFIPKHPSIFYYNRNNWKVDSITGRALFFICDQTLGLCAYRSLLLEHYRARVERVKREGHFDRSIGFEPGTHHRPRGIDDHHAESWMSEVPNIDIRHGGNLTRSRWRQDQFRNQKYCQGWEESDSIRGWGHTLGRFNEFLTDVERDYGLG